MPFTEPSYKKYRLPDAIARARDQLAFLRLLVEMPFYREGLPEDGLPRVLHTARDRGLADESAFLRLLEETLSLNPRERLSAGLVVDHEFFTKVVANEFYIKTCLITRRCPGNI